MICDKIILSFSPFQTWKKLLKQWKLTKLLKNYDSFYNTVFAKIKFYFRINQKNLPVSPNNYDDYNSRGTKNNKPYLSNICIIMPSMRINIKNNSFTKILRNNKDIYRIRTQNWLSRTPIKHFSLKLTKVTALKLDKITRYKYKC